MSFSEKMLRYRAAQNMTQAHLAELLGVSRITICNIENNKQNASKLLEMKLEILMQGGENNEL